MKKLMVTAVAIAMAVVANAASVKWSCPDGIADATETGFTSASVIYLINAAELSQSDIYTAVMGGASLADAVSGHTVKSLSLDEGGFSATTFDVAYTAGTKQTFYMTCFDESLNAVYFSEEIEKTLSGTGAMGYRYDALSSLDGVAADMSGFDKSYGGWVSTAAVPEPTSGLLMLLGMAGLALRRRRA